MLDRFRKARAGSRNSSSPSARHSLTFHSNLHDGEDVAGGVGEPCDRTSIGVVDPVLVCGDARILLDPHSFRGQLADRPVYVIDGEVEDRECAGMWSGLA